MLFEALSQPMIFFWLSFGGFFAGFLFDIKNILNFSFKKNKIIDQILLFFSVFGTLFLCFFLNLIFNYGQFRFFSIFAFILSFSLQRFISANFVANPIIKCYNKIKARRNERKRKVVEKV